MLYDLPGPGVGWIVVQEITEDKTTVLGAIIPEVGTIVYVRNVPTLCKRVIDAMIDVLMPTDEVCSPLITDVDCIETFLPMLGVARICDDLMPTVEGFSTSITEVLDEEIFLPIVEVGRMLDLPLLGFSE